MFEKKIKKLLVIEGISCNHCAKRIESSLLNLEQVKSIKVDLDSKEATIILKKDVDNQILKEKIDNLGFNLLEVKNI